MATTFLQMVNRVLGGLREERIAAFVTDDPKHESIKDLVNDAARFILERVTWPFDIRSDLSIDFRGTTALSSAFLLGTGFGVRATFSDTTERDEFWTEYTTKRLLMRIILDSASTADGALLNSQSYPIINMAGGAGLSTLNLIPRVELLVEGDNTPYTWVDADNPATVFSHEVVLASTVRSLLHLRNEERPIPLVYEDPMRFNAYNPRPQDSTGDPVIAYVHGTGTSTYSNDTAIVNGPAVSGDILTVWPIPDKRIRLYGSYVYRHAALSATTDTLSNVPDSVADLIIRLALIMGLEGMEGNDPVRAASMRQQLFGRDGKSGDFGNLLGSLDKTPYERLVTPSFGKAGHLPTRQRWATQTVPAPS